jgi:His/Glu/Gln/Arg/opine family amino acid ABC transporter permease subunit
MTILDVLPSLARGLQYTLTITTAAFAVGLIIAVPITAARRSSLAPVRWLGGAYVELMRAVPPLPWLFLVFFGGPALGLVLDPVSTGILVFGLVSGAYLTEVYRAGFRAVPRGQDEAANALGLGRVDVYRRVLIPQALRTMLPLAIAYGIGLLKDSAVVSVIGVQDVSARAVIENRATGEGLTVFVAAGLVYLALSLPVAALGRWLARRLDASPEVKV